MKLIAAFIFSLFSLNASAAVNCVGVPQATKVGEFGNQEGYLIVTINGLDFRLGPVGDAGARSRLAIATAALAANRSLLLKFWDSSDCNAASLSQAVPSSTQVLQ